MATSTASWPDGGGRLECRAGPPRPNYAQARSAHADRGPAGPPGGRIPRPGQRAGLPGYGRLDAAGAAHIAALDAPGAAAVAPAEPRFLPFGPARRRPGVA